MAVSSNLTIKERAEKCTLALNLLEDCGIVVFRDIGVNSIREVFPLDTASLSDDEIFDILKDCAEESEDATAQAAMGFIKNHFSQ